MAPRFAVRFLTEAGPSIGLGHLCRCVALYDALEARGGECEIVLDGVAPAHLVGDRAISECNWLNSSTVDGILRDVDIVVIDSYQADLSVYEAAAARSGVAVYLDDTARLAYPRDFVVNGNPDADRLPWPDGSVATRLLGVQYQLLRREFVGVAERDTHPAVGRVLVVSGGTDATATLGDLGALARQVYPGAHIDVASGTRTAREMCAAMLEADVALSAAGQTLYELAATGTPVVAVTVADNQVSQASAFGRAGALLLAGAWGAQGTGDRVVEMLEELRNPVRRAGLSAEARRLVDGKGAERVARTIVGDAIAGRLDLRRAIDADEGPLLQLANDPLVRSASFSNRTITEQEHHSWFKAHLQDPSCLLLLALDRGKLAGYVRLQVEGERAVVSIALSESYRGLGLADKLLEGGAAALAECGVAVHELTAQVRGDNLTSQRLFERAGFRATSDATGLPPGGVEYRKAL